MHTAVKIHFFTERDGIVSLLWDYGFATKRPIELKVQRIDIYE
jgi:hypothetical protein